MDAVRMNYTSFSGIIVFDAIHGQFLDVWFNVGKTTIRASCYRRSYTDIGQITKTIIVGSRVVILKLEKPYGQPNLT